MKLLNACTCFKSPLELPFVADLKLPSSPVRLNCSGKNANESLVCSGSEWIRRFSVQVVVTFGGRTPLSSWSETETNHHLHSEPNRRICRRSLAPALYTAAVVVVIMGFNFMNINNQVMNNLRCSEDKGPG